MKKQIAFLSVSLSMVTIFSFSCRQSLSEQESNSMVNSLYADWVKQYKDSNEIVWNRKEIICDSLRMKFDYRILGNMPSDGRSLYISLHGGGKTPARVNDQQWENQKGLYTPEEGVYIAPRAPWDDWNMWFKPGIDALYDELIHLAVAMENVNPDKVYLLGYSAGGDGLYRIAPRMADRWAAASMMAGHPGEASQVNLRNLPFMIWMGEEDGAYDRNRWAETIGKRLDSLQTTDPDGYIHETHIIAGKGHWMDQADTLAIAWMEKHTRNPYPEKIIWQQEEVVLPSFYWLSVSREEAKSGMRVVVSRFGNTIQISENDYKELMIFLNDEMFDLESPIIIKYKDEEIFNGKVNRKIQNMEETLNSRKDVRYIFPSKLTVLNNRAAR